MSLIDIKAAVLVALDLVHVVEQGDDGSLTAIVDGEHGSYEVRRWPSGCWSCECEAWYWRLECSHQRAVERLTTQLAL